MKTIQNTHLIYFSPTRTSAKVAHAVAKGLGAENGKEIDFTYAVDLQPLTVRDALVVIAVPVYGGRVAPVALKRLQRVKAENSRAILIVLYGNRAYEDALVELYDEAVQMGFTPVAAAAFVGEHSFSQPELPIAQGRPDGSDLQRAEAFGREVLHKLETGTLEELLSVPGNRPYREFGPSSPIIPTPGEGCTGCESCFSVCPTDAISMNQDGFALTNPGECIKCCACVRACPTGDRVFDSPFTAFLHTNFKTRREVELFL